MNKYVLLSVTLPLFFLVNCKQSPKADAEVLTGTSEHQGEAIYKTNCAGCHGADLSGNSAGALVKSEWTYGRTKNLMLRNVRFGIPGTDMAAFNEVLNDGEIQWVVDYIREQQTLPPNRTVVIPDQVKTIDYTLEVKTIGEGQLATPWAIEFTDEKRALISERDGALKWLIEGIVDTQEIIDLPIPHIATSTGGFMDIALDPDYQDNQWVYLSYSDSKGSPSDKEAATTTKVIRGKVDGHRWIDQQILFEAPDSLWVTKGNRWGCRFLFDEKGQLLFTIGDMARDMDSQDPRKVSGKVFRVNPDGSIPVDNPYKGVEGAVEAIFSLGNRNVQGLAIHPGTGQIWASEHGPMGGDELNILKAGANYGWPIITHGKQYSGGLISDKTAQEGMEQPVHQWTPSIGVCPIEFVTGTSFSKWSNNLLVGALTFEELQRHVIRDGRIVETEMLLKEMGRVRDIKIAPDGSLFVVLNQPDLIIRLSPIPSGI